MAPLVMVGILHQTNETEKKSNVNTVIDSLIDSVRRVDGRFASLVVVDGNTVISLSLYSSEYQLNLRLAFVNSGCHRRFLPVVVISCNTHIFVSIVVVCRSSSAYFLL